MDDLRRFQHLPEVGSPFRVADQKLLLSGPLIGRSVQSDLPPSPFRVVSL